MFIEKKDKISIKGSYDVIVCGGGPAGIIAAAAAARNGSKTLLIERYGFVGGMAASGLVTPVCDFCKNGKLIIKGIPYELMERASLLDGADISPLSGYFPVNDEIFKLAAQRLLLESGVTLLYHTYFSDCVMEEGRISHIIVQNKSGRGAYAGKVFIDCTGDADIVRAAGYKTFKREQLQPASLWFQLGGVDTNAMKSFFEKEFYDIMPWSEVIREKLSELKEKGEMPLFGGPWISKFFHDGMVTINLLREGTDASSPEQFTLTECNMRENLHRVIQVLRENFTEFKNCWLVKSGIQTGVRETYRIDGMYRITEDDVLNPKPFSDTIAKGAHVIDIHKPDSTEIELVIPAQEYNIPYGVLVPKDSMNLITAGRCICSDDSAFGTIRVMATCMATGQAAGTAAAFCIRTDAPLNELDGRSLRGILKEQGVIV